MTVLFAIAVLTGAEVRELSIKEVVARVDSFDPQLRVRALEEARAEINLRRAKWNQMSGGLGLNAQETLQVDQLGSLPAKVQGATGALQVLKPAPGSQLAANLVGQVNYPIYAGGAIMGAIDAAAARAKASAADLEALRRDLRRTALTAYGQLIATGGQVEIAETARSRGQNLVDLAERKRATGVGTDADVARAKLNLLGKQEDVEVRRGDQSLAQAALRALLLLDAGTDIRATDDLEQLTHYGDMSAALERPELLSLRSQGRAAAFDRKVAFAGYLPQVSLFAAATYGNGSFLTLNGVPIFSGASNTWYGVFSGTISGGVALNWTGFDFFVTRDKVAAAEAMKSELEAQLADRVRQVAREVDEARAREEQSQRRVAALSGGKETAATAVRLARARYESGNAILTEVLDAEIEAIGIESRQVQAAFDFASAHLERLHAEGGRL